MTDKLQGTLKRSFSVSWRILFFTIVCTCSTLLVRGQIDMLNFIFDDTHDSTYVISYEKFFIGRVFLSQKFTRFDIVDRDAGSALNYRPNTSLNLGLGFTYGKFSVNVSKGFRFLNPENGRGETDWLDLQTRIYARRYIIDLYGQFYEGFYLKNSSDHTHGNSGEDLYYLREDIRLRQLGVSFMYIFNSERFSYRASFTQNEWQQKSAGSLLLGLETYGGFNKGDSTMIPYNVEPTNFFNRNAIREVSYFEIGPSAGYAYTYVLRRNWFATAHISANLSLGWISETTNFSERQSMGLYPNFLYRFVVGYNSPKWFAGASLINNSLQFRSALGNFRYRTETGNLRFSVAMRFVPSPGTRRYFKIIEDLGLAPKS
jgi:hypothetical protein